MTCTVNHMDRATGCCPQHVIGDCCTHLPWESCLRQLCSASSVLLSGGISSHRQSEHCIDETAAQKEMPSVAAIARAIYLSRSPCRHAWSRCTAKQELFGSYGPNRKEPHSFKICSQQHSEPLTSTTRHIHPHILSLTMLSRSSLSRQAQRAVRQSVQQRRGLAAPASGSFSYEQGDAQGIKYAARDIPGPVATLAIVAKAGTRYQPLPGLTEGLERYAFKVRSNGSRSKKEESNIK